MNEMEITKIVAGVCGALLLLLLTKWGAETIYHVGGDAHGGHGAHSEETVLAGYPIEVPEETSGAVVEEGPSLEELLAVADLGKGEKVFSKCKACHKLEDGANGTGPHLFGVVNRAIGSIGGFGYSSVLAENGGNWDAANLDAFLEAPKKYAPGTKMSFNGLKKPADRANLIAYLETVQ